MVLNYTEFEHRGEERYSSWPPHLMSKFNRTICPMSGISELSTDIIPDMLNSLEALYHLYGGSYAPAGEPSEAGDTGDSVSTESLRVAHSVSGLDEPLFQHKRRLEHFIGVSLSVFPVRRFCCIMGYVQSSTGISTCLVLHGSLLPCSITVVVALRHV
ncbi:hypothetical protein TNCV_1128521 [Trichonephila clavipes]|nr:hypothetical protein TNCV_1128521 [Trichonephila clavipes]